MKKTSLFTLIFTLLLAVACPPPPPVGPENPSAGGNTDADVPQGGLQPGAEIVYRFEPNGGVGSAFSRTVRFAEEFTFPENPFIKENYAFVGWSTNKNATSSNQLSQPGEKELVYSKSPYTYYAIWERGRMTVTYDPMVENGKTVTVDALNQDGYIVLADGDDLFAVKAVKFSDREQRSGPAPRRSFTPPTSQPNRKQKAFRLTSIGEAVGRSMRRVRRMKLMNILGQSGCPM